MTQGRRKALSALVILASPVAAVLTYLVCRDNVPARIPDPWDWTGGLWWSDGGTRTDLFFVSLLPAWIILVVALALLARTNGQRRGVVLGLVFGGSLGLFLWMKSMLISYGAPNTSAIQPQFWQNLLTVILLSAYTRTVEFVLPIPTQPPKTPLASNISLEPGQRVAWFGRATSGWKLWVGVALVAASVPVAVANPSASIAVLFVAALLLWGCMAKVRIDERSVTVARGPLGWPKFSVQLPQVTAASTYRIKSLYWGSGAKVSTEEGDARSLLVRAGDAVVIGTRHGLPIYVSVDHAEEAANFINALIVRSQLANLHDEPTTT